MVCEKCGKILPDDSSFCNSCGNILNDYEETGRLDEFEQNNTNAYNGNNAQEADGEFAFNPFENNSSQTPVSDNEIKQTNSNVNTCNYNNTQSPIVGGGFEQTNTNVNTYNYSNMQSPIVGGGFEQTNTNVNAYSYNNVQAPIVGGGFEQTNTNVNAYSYNNVQAPIVGGGFEQNNTNAYNNMQSNEYTNYPAMAAMDYNAFYENFASKNLKSWTKSFYIICFITVAVSLVPIFMDSLLSIIDVVFYGVMGFLILKKKYWVFTLIVTLFSGIFTVIGIVTTGTFTGIVALVAGIFATKGLKKLQNAFDTYKRTGCVPESEIK